MAEDTRAKDCNWNVGTVASWERAKTALLMDIRDEMKQLNSQLRTNGYGQDYLAREIRGLRRDVKARVKPRCHRKHA